MIRVPNWNVRLVELANEVLGKPFVWGETDCASVARRAVAVMYEDDPVAQHIKVTYTTKVGAARAFKKIGSMIDILLAAGAKEVRPDLTQDGDIMVFPKNENAGYENLATRIGSMWIVSSPEEGRVLSTKIRVTSLDPDVRVFRF
jgi:hypothetical protein